MTLSSRVNRLKRTIERDSTPDMEFTVKRSPKQQELKIYKTESAKTAVGILSPGIERYVMSKGQYSLIDFIEAILDQIGPSHIVISTWTAAGADISDAFLFLKSGKLLSCRFIVDFTFHRRKPQFCGQLRQMFGDGAIRVTRTLAKFVILTNEIWNITVFTSANLNTNPRMEYFLIRESSELANFNLDVINHLFKTKSDDEINIESAAYHIKEFKNE